MNINASLNHVIVHWTKQCGKKKENNDYVYFKNVKVGLTFRIQSVNVICYINQLRRQIIWSPT